MSMRNCGFFWDDKDDGDEGLEGQGEGQPPFADFQSQTNSQEYKLPIAVKETFWLFWSFIEQKT